MTSEWPDKSFVIECIIISAPKSRGLIDNGVVNVLSTTSSILFFLQIFEIFIISEILSVGFEISSIITILVFFVIDSWTFL